MPEKALRLKIGHGHLSVPCHAGLENVGANSSTSEKRRRVMYAVDAWSIESSACLSIVSKLLRATSSDSLVYQRVEYRAICMPLLSPFSILQWL